MSEKELKFERKSKIISCASSNYQTCAAYASIECENCDEID